MFGKYGVVNNSEPRFKRYCFEPAAFSGRYAMSGNHNHLIQQRSKRLPPEEAMLAVNPPRPFEKLVETTTRGNQTDAACFTLQIF